MIFYEIRRGTEEDWDFECLVKTELDADRFIRYLNEVHPMDEFFYQKVKFVAEFEVEDI